MISGDSKIYHALTGTMPEGSIFGCTYCRISSSRVSFPDTKSLRSQQFVHVEPKVMYLKIKKYFTNDR